MTIIPDKTRNNIFVKNIRFASQTDNRWMKPEIFFNVSGVVTTTLFLRCTRFIP